MLRQVLIDHYTKTIVTLYLPQRNVFYAEDQLCS